MATPFDRCFKMEEKTSIRPRKVSAIMAGYLKMYTKISENGHNGLEGGTRIVRGSMKGRPPGVGGGGRWAIRRYHKGVCKQA